MPVGYAGLVAAYALDCPVPRRALAVATFGVKRVVISGGTEWLVHARGRLRVPSRPIDHLTLALKHEELDLRVLDRLFRRIAVAELAGLVAENPNGVHARRAWFLYEWMTGESLPLDPVRGLQYVPVLDPTRYFVARPRRSTRQLVDDNLPGVSGFCPVVRRTERLTEARFTSLRESARATMTTADPAVLRRAIAYMLLSESKGSFGIEGESPPQTRLERWGSIVAAAGGVELSIAELERLQRALFDRSPIVALGVRKEGGFVGRHDRDAETPIPDHVSARPEDLPSLLDGLLGAFARLEADGIDPVLTATVIGFGFVFMHPFEDGNGRLHRYLVQKALIDGGFNPPGIVLPVSAAMLEDLAGYRAVLEDYSLPTLESIEWQPTTRGNVEVLNDTAYLYRYFDATRQAEYLTDCIERTVRFALPNELDYLHRFDDAKRRVADVADLPDRLASLLIQFCVQNQGTVSARKRAEYFQGVPAGVIAALEQAVWDSGIVPADSPTETNPASP